MTPLSVPLGALASLITKGTTPTTLGYSFVEAGIPFLRVQNIFSGQVNFAADTLFISPSTHAALKRSQIQAGDVLVTIAGTIGRTGVVPKDVPQLNCNQAVAIVRPTDRVDRGFLRHWLESSEARGQMSGSTVTGTISNLSLSQLGQLKLKLPSIAEQRRIAAILDQAETLRTQRRAALAQLDSLAQSIFLDMFESGEELQRWKHCELQDVVKPGAIVTYGIVQAGEEYPGGVPYIRTGDLAGDTIVVTGLRHTDPALAAKFSRSRVETGEIVMSIRATVGTTALVPPELNGANLTQGTARISPGPAMNSRYLLSFLRSRSTQHWISRQVKGATFREITLGRLRELPVVVPPLGLQQTFAARVEAIESLKTAHRAALTHLDALFASLQHRAFNGELTRSTVSAVVPAKAKAHSLEALRQLDAEVGLEALIYVARRIPGNDLYKSLKSLYFGEKHHLEHHGRQIYNETYCALPMGPVPQAAYDATKVLSGDLLISPFADDVLRSAFRYAKNKLIPLRDADFGKLGSAERESLEWAIRYCGQMSFSEVKQASHDTAYHRTPINAEIALEDIVGMLPAKAQRRFAKPAASN